MASVIQIVRLPVFLQVSFESFNCFDAVPECPPIIGRTGRRTLKHTAVEALHNAIFAHFS